MSVSIQWNTPEKTALILTFTAPWTWDQYEELSDNIQTTFDSVIYDIDLIVDLSKAGDIPESTLNQLRDAYAGGMSNLGQYIFVGATPEFIQQLDVVDHYLTILGGLLSYDCVETLEDAQRVVRWKRLVSAYRTA